MIESNEFGKTRLLMNKSDYTIMLGKMLKMKSVDGNLVAKEVDLMEKI